MVEIAVRKTGKVPKLVLLEESCALIKSSKGGGKVLWFDMVKNMKKITPEQENKLLVLPGAT
jgi:hypothetical protein